MLNQFQVAAIAKSHPEGFTVCKKTGSPITSGYAVAVADTQNSHNAKDLKTVMERASLEDIQAIGGWYNNTDGKYYYDAVMIIDDYDRAIEAGLTNQQLAIFHLDTLTEIRLDQAAAAI